MSRIQYITRRGFLKKAAGVTAGASTPDWIIDEFAKNLEALDNGA